MGTDEDEEDMKAKYRRAFHRLSPNFRLGGIGKFYHRKAIDVGYPGEEKIEFKNLAWKDPTINAIDRRHKTVVVQIHLERNRADIVKDLGFLLNRLEKEAKRLDVSLTKRKPRYDMFDRFIKTYELRREGKSWRQIADALLPQDASPESAKEKVRYYYDRARKMIDNEEWRNI